LKLLPPCAASGGGLLRRPLAIDEQRLGAAFRDLAVHHHFLDLFVVLLLFYFVVVLLRSIGKQVL
jgi:hypothetical protein